MFTPSLDSHPHPASPLRRIVRVVLGLAAFTIIAGCASASGRTVQTSPLAGTWVLTGAPEIRPDGTTGFPYGTDPKGLLVVDATGRYSLQIFRADRARFASSDKRQGTPEEYRSASLGMSSHFGRCFIDSASGRLIFRIEHASFPNWDGTEQKREYQLAGDELTYRVPASATGNGTIAVSSWRRVR
jgi:hypothetical protein